MYLGGPGVDLQRTVEVGDRLVLPAGVGPDQPADLEAEGKLRVEPECLAEIGQGAVSILVQPAGLSAVGPNQCVLRVVLQGFAVGGDGRCVLPAIRENDAPDVVSVRVGRVKAEG